MAGRELTRERWLRALEALRGQREGCGISDRAAADAAGVSVSELRSWVRRSRSCGADDEEWVLRIAAEYDEAVESRGAVLEGEALDRALLGNLEPLVKCGKVVGHVRRPDSNLLMRVLAANCRRYAKQDEPAVRVTLDIGDLFQRFQARARIEAAEMERVRGSASRALEGSAEEVPDL